MSGDIDRLDDETLPSSCAIGVVRSGYARQSEEGGRNGQNRDKNRGLDRWRCELTNAIADEHSHPGLAGKACNDRALFGIPCVTDTTQAPPASESRCHAISRSAHWGQRTSSKPPITAAFSFLRLEPTRRSGETVKNAAEGQSGK